MNKKVVFEGYYNLLIIDVLYFFLFFCYI